jgi:hypothetical protein
LLTSALFGVGWSVWHLCRCILEGSIRQENWSARYWKEKDLLFFSDIEPRSSSPIKDQKSSNFQKGLYS